MSERIVIDQAVQEAPLPWHAFPTSQGGCILDDGSGPGRSFYVLITPGDAPLAAAIAEAVNAFCRAEGQGEPARGLRNVSAWANHPLPWYSEVGPDLQPLLYDATGALVGVFPKGELFTPALITSACLWAAQGPQRANARGE